MAAILSRDLNAENRSRFAQRDDIGDDILATNGYRHSPREGHVICPRTGRSVPKAVALREVHRATFGEQAQQEVAGERDEAGGGHGATMTGAADRRQGP